MDFFREASSVRIFSIACREGCSSLNPGRGMTVNSLDIRFFLKKYSCNAHPLTGSTSSRLTHPSIYVRSALTNSSVMARHIKAIMEPDRCLDSTHVLPSSMHLSARL